MMEKWNAYTRDGALTDGILYRGEPIPDGLYSMGSEVLVRHTDGSFLCMKRAETKPVYLGYYEATAGGAALFGENQLQCIQRELYEETGILCECFEEIGCAVCEEDHSICYSFLCTVDCDKHLVVLQEGETEDYLWMMENEFVSFVNSDRFIASQKRRFYPYFLKMGYIK